MKFQTFIRSLRRRTKIIFVFFVLVLAWMLWPHESTKPLLKPPIPLTLDTQPCIDLLPDKGPFKEAAVWQTGRYCVAMDFWQRRFCGAGHCAPAAYRHLLDIRGGDVTIDLRNHTLHSDGHSSGIIAYAQSNKSSLIPGEPNFAFTQDTRKITLKNGVIDLRGGGIGVELINRWNALFIDSPIPASLTAYEKTAFILENLRITTDNTSIILEGEGNIIRNCIIESGGVAAIMMAGPNGQIVDNTIILNSPFIPGNMRPRNFNELRDISALIREKRRPKAAISLHQASGTLIRGNRIEVKENSSTRHNIYLTDASKDVRVEGNTFIGSEKPVTLDKDSTAIFRDNVFESAKSWWRF
jgi:hypothetical protein